MPFLRREYKKISNFNSQMILALPRGIWIIKEVQ